MNKVIQSHIHRLDRRRDDAADTQTLEGIRLFDKVIQIRNRPKSNPIRAYNLQTKSAEKIEVFNGELAYVKPHAFDKDKLGWAGFRLKQFQVVFARKEHLWVSYGGGESVEENLELAYAISVHKAQGSEFGRIYFVVPKNKRALLSPELFYTGVTRAHRHCTLLVEEDVSPLLSMRRR